MIGPELAQAQFLVELAEKPAGAPWARAAQLQFGKLDAHQLGVIGHDAVFGKKRDRARLGLAVFVKVDRLLPVGFLLVVDFAQVEHVRWTILFPAQRLLSTMLQERCSLPIFFRGVQCKNIMAEDYAQKNRAWE